MTSDPRSSTAPLLESLATALPPHSYLQRDIKPFAAEMFLPGLDAADHRLMAVFDTAGIERRHFCMPLEWYATKRDFAESNAKYVEHATELAVRAASAALGDAGLGPGDVDQLIFVSTTGISTPSIEARLMNRLPFRPDLRRIPVWGLGCAGGTAGLALARTLALGAPRSRILLIALELCSLTFQRADLDRRNLVAASLFSDGAAAAVIRGPHAKPAPRALQPALEVVAAQNTLWPETLDVMGWDIDASGLHVVFSRDIPTIVRDRVRPHVDGFLECNRLDRSGIDHLLAHPGGPRVIAALAEALEFPMAHLERSRQVLEQCGNMSSPTCLFVVERAWKGGDLAPGQHALVSALGPGFASELVLLRAADA